MHFTRCPYLYPPIPYSKKNMSFIPFDLEYAQSKWEQIVDFNLTESGVHPMQLAELINGDSQLLEALMTTEINYPHVNGNPELRENIARLYNGADISNILVTVGAAEANHIIMQTLMEEGDELLTQTPTYKQVWGIALNTGHTVHSFRLMSEAGWAVDLDELKQNVNSRTKIVAICNPNNPTGYIMTEAEMKAVVEVADSVGAWILADEVYRGAERERETETPSFFGMYDKVLALGSMSKAYGLPGLRVGWIAGPPDMIEDIWRRHEYTAITAGCISNKLAAHALSPAVRPRIIQRTRAYIQAGFPTLENWMNAQEGLFSYTPSQASAVSFIKYNLDINSTELMEILCREASVFVGSGDSFGMDHHLRIAFGQEKELLDEALARIEKTLKKLS